MDLAIPEIKSRMPEVKILILTFHTSEEYILEAFHRVNEINAKRMVLYLAKHGSEERSRKQIREDLQLEMSDNDLELRLHKLRMADLIARGSSFSHYKGLGDPIFEVVFRRAYGPEIEAVEPAAIIDDFDRFMTQLMRQTAWIKGLNGEYKVRYHLYVAAANGIPLKNIVFNPTRDLTLAPFASTDKERISYTTETDREIDIYARSLDEHGCDLVVEVKNWEKTVSNEELERFFQLKTIVEKKVSRKTGYLFYSENGFTEEQRAKLVKHGAMYTTGKKLISYETGLDA